MASDLFPLSWTITQPQIKHGGADQRLYTQAPNEQTAYLASAHYFINCIWIRVLGQAADVVGLAKSLSK